MTDQTQRVEAPLQYDEIRMEDVLSRIRALPAGIVPDSELLADLLSAWGNPDFQAGLHYLTAVAHWATDTEGAILECGSGITSVLLGVLAERKNQAVATLEHDAQWHSLLVSALSRHSIRTVEVHLAPLVNYVGFDWYELPNDMSGPFSLVICDGPPGVTVGGRYGLMPLMNPALPTGTVILFDDTERGGEQEVMARWESEYGVSLVSTSPSEPRGPKTFSVLRRLS